MITILLGAGMAMASRASPRGSVRMEASLSRRELGAVATVSALGVLGALTPARPAAASLGAGGELEASWTATDSFGDKSAAAGLIAFDETAYKAMAGDRKRTPQFAKAIARRLKGKEGELTILDIGTGPYALLAILAAKAGAKKVYAVEAVPAAATLARRFVAKAEANGDVRRGQIEIIDGLSTELTLPEKVDLVLAEVIGTVASEEGAYATIRDAQLRHVKRPTDPSSWIPVKVQTLGAPCSYSVHSLLTPPDFDWTKLEGAPVRLNCRETAVQMLDAPQLVEEIRFYEPLPAIGRVANSPQPQWTVDGARIAANAAVYAKEIRSDGTADMAVVGAGVASGFSGIALWPRLQLDEDGVLFVESRGPLGESGKSHWTTAIALLAQSPLPVKAGDRVSATLSVELGGAVRTPPRYSLRASVQPTAA